MPEAELLLLSGDRVCTNAQSCGCYCTQCDCGNAKVTSLRSLCIVGTALGAVGTGRTTGAAVIAAVGRTAIVAVRRTAVAACCGSCSFACCSGLARISSCTIRICVLRCLSGRCRISSCRTAASFNTADVEVYNQGVACTQAACTRQILIDIIFMRTGTSVVQNAVTQALAVISSSQRSSRFPHCNCSGRTICMLNFNRIDLDLCCAVLKRIAAFFYK